MSIDQVKAAIRDVADFPKPGIVFKDITPVLQDASVFRMANDLFYERYRNQGIDKVAGIDARGFIFGSVLADRLGCGFIPIRKKGKLPFDAHEVSYDLEYGSATLELHVDATGHGDRVVVIDDLLATGGTAAATVELLNKLECNVIEVAFLVELAFLGGREKLADVAAWAPVVY